MPTRISVAAKTMALALLDTMQPPIPARIARWMPWFLLASPREVAQIDRLRARLR